MGVFSSLEKFEKDLCSRVEPNEGVRVAVAVVEMDPGPPDFITSRWLFGEPRRDERQAAYGRLRLREWWLDANLAVATLLGVLRGGTPLQGVTWQLGPIVGERYTALDRTYTGWAEEWYHTRLQAERRYRGGVLRELAAASGLRPHTTGAHAVADWVWGDVRRVSGGDPPYEGQLIVIVPDKRARMRPARIESGRVEVVVEARAEGVELQALAHTESAVVPLASQRVEVGPETTVSLNLPGATTALELALVAGGEVLAQRAVSHPDAIEELERWVPYGSESPVEREAAVRRLGLEGLHPEILKVSSDLFTDGHYSQAIFEAFKAVEVRVRGMSRLELVGEKLMAAAFNESTSRIGVAVESGVLGKDEQRGFKLLFMGAMAAIRNPKGHGLVEQRDPQRTLEYLAFASLLMRRLDDAAVSAERP